MPQLFIKKKKKLSAKQVFLKRICPVCKEANTLHRFPCRVSVAEPVCAGQSPVLMYVFSGRKKQAWWFCVVRKKKYIYPAGSSSLCGCVFNNSLIFFFCLILAKTFSHPLWRIICFALKRVCRSARGELEWTIPNRNQYNLFFYLFFLIRLWFLLRIGNTFWWRALQCQASLGYWWLHPRVQ